MAELPRAKTSIDDEAGAFAGGTGYRALVGCAERNADSIPRVFASAKALMAQHGYSQAADYAALHIEKTQKPIVFVAIPTATVGTVTPGVADEITGTSVVAAAAGANGILEEVNGIATVVKGGTIGTNGIEIDLSLDGGRSTKRIRLGTATSYVIPYVGITLTFAAGTLIAGDIFRFRSTAPMWNAAGLTAARTALAAQMKFCRSMLIVGDLTGSTLAGNVVTEVNAYETANDRFVFARAQVRDRLLTGETMAAWVALMDSTYAGVDNQRRVDLGLGRLYKQSPIHQWELRRPVSWAASVREYEHDVHIPTWRKADGPLDGWKMDDPDGTITEFDERTDGGGLAGRFTCARTYANGPVGAFIALSLTRAPESSLLSRTHNMAVCNLACTIVQAESENAIGQVLELNPDGTAKPASLQLIESRVNSALEDNLLKGGPEGPRASRASWSASKTDKLNKPAAELTGVCKLLINGTLEKITTSVRVQTAGGA